ncbi:MAG: SDR family NAD(P)-dependent oxidoreductase [Acidobacteriota bacterium]|nr:SDR family NAD(P)-dependent oxidoreductase [Acidobacteriota bacterium]
MSFNGRVVLVTGAARGIGRIVAQQFAENGAQVALHFHSNREAAEATFDSLAGDSHSLHQADFTDATQAQQLVEAVIRQHGRLDILVNNAAIFEAHPIAKVSYDDWQVAWQRTINTNLIGAANVTFCAARQMIQQGTKSGGRIVNISSRGAFRGEPDAPAYGASKAALNAMSQSLAQALAPHNIFVYVVAPGFVETERVAYRLDGAEGEGIRNQSPLRRVAKPEEVAKTVLFLASEGTDFLTGGIVDVNGASYLRS